MATEQICKDCDNAIFCETMGEYKCVLYGHRVYFPNLIRSCFVPAKTPVLEKKCRCRVCVERGCLDDVEEQTD